MKSSSQVRVAVAVASEETRKLPGECPGCGQRIDPVNRRCPRCRLWLLPLRAQAPRGVGVTRAAAITALALTSALVGLVLYVLLSNEPPNVVLPAADIAILD